VTDGYLFVPCFIVQHNGMYNFKIDPATIHLETNTSVNLWGDEFMSQLLHY